MSELPALRLYKGRTTHVRYTPFERRFDYRIFMIDIDIDRLEEAAKSSVFFSVGTPNLFSFKQKDHGAKDGSALRPWAEAEFSKAGVSLDGGHIRLVTFPRGLFYKFAPLSIWFGHGPDRELRGVIYEVNNTFGENALLCGKSRERPQSAQERQELSCLTVLGCHWPIPVHTVPGREETRCRHRQHRRRGSHSYGQHQGQGAASDLGQFLKDKHYQTALNHRGHHWDSLGSAVVMVAGCWI